MNNILVVPYIQETSLNENNTEQNMPQMEREVKNFLILCVIKGFISQNSCDNSSTLTKPISSIHTGHYTDSGISMSGSMTSAITERPPASLIPGSKNEHFNDPIQGENGILQ